jgi:hypothetical protein
MAVLDLENQAGLLAEIEDFGSTVLTNKVKEFLITTNVQNFWESDQSWLPDVEIFQKFDELASSYYTHYRAYHACRPRSVKSFYENGFIGQNSNQLAKEFKDIFSDVDQVVLQSIIENCARRGELERGEICFATSPKNLVERDGHYLIYGSEYIQAMTRELCEKKISSEDYMLRLKNYGRPTLFEVNVPQENIQSSQRIRFSGLLIAFWGKNILGVQDLIDYQCFSSHSDIPPENIMTHFHPAVICDPLNENSAYKSENIICDVCGKA